MSAKPDDQPNILGSFIRAQRQMANLSLRQLSALTEVSNPYLSQIERGLRKPSAEILQQIARALRISAEALYVQAGILEERYGDSDVPAAILSDAHLAERQKQVLLELYEAYRRETDAAIAANSQLAASTPPVSTTSGASKTATSRTRTARRAKPGATATAAGTKTTKNSATKPNPRAH